MDKEQRIAKLQAEIAELQGLGLDKTPKNINKMEVKINDYLKKKLAESIAELKQLQE